MSKPTLHQAVRSLLSTIIDCGPHVPDPVLDAARAVSFAMERDRKAKRRSQAQANVGRKPHPKRDECIALLESGVSPGEVAKRTGVSRTTVERYRSR